MTRERYSPERMAEVAGLRASGLTHKAIAERTGIPRRSVGAILARKPVSTVVEAATLEQVSSRLWAVVSAGTEEALRRIHDPATKAGELAQILKVAADQYALLNGQATERTENVNLNVEVERPPLLPEEKRAALWEALGRIENASDDELDAATENELRILTNMTRKLLTGKAQNGPIEGVHYFRGGPDYAVNHAAWAQRAQDDAQRWQSTQDGIEAETGRPSWVEAEE